MKDVIKSINKALSIYRTVNSASNLFGKLKKKADIKIKEVKTAAIDNKKKTLDEIKELEVRIMSMPVSQTLAEERNTLLDYIRATYTKMKDNEFADKELIKLYNLVANSYNNYFNKLK